MWRSLFFLSLAGCTAAEVRAFAQERAEAVCAWHTRCETLDDAGFTDEAECNSRLSDSVDALDRNGELGCDGFDPTAADACVAVWRDAACDTVPDVSVCDTVCED